MFFPMPGGAWISGSGMVLLGIAALDFALAVPQPAGA